MTVLSSEDEVVWRAGMASQQEHLNRHLINVSRTNIRTLRTEELLVKLHVNGIYKCPVVKASRSILG